MIVDIVFAGELPAARARARAGDPLELVQVLGRDLPGRVRTDALVNVCDRDLLAAEETGAIDPV